MTASKYKLACPKCGTQMHWLESYGAPEPDFWCCPACGEEPSGLYLGWLLVWSSIKSLFS